MRFFFPRDFHHSVFSPFFDPLMALTFAHSRQPWWRQLIYSPKRPKRYFLTVNGNLLFINGKVKALVRCESRLFSCPCFIFPSLACPRGNGSSVAEVEAGDRLAGPVRRAGAAKGQLGGATRSALLHFFPQVSSSSKMIGRRRGLKRSYRDSHSKERKHGRFLSPGMFTAPRSSRRRPLGVFGGPEAAVPSVCSAVLAEATCVLAFCLLLFGVSFVFCFLLYLFLSFLF